MHIFLIHMLHLIEILRSITNRPWSDIPDILNILQDLHHGPASGIPVSAKNWCFWKFFKYHSLVEMNLLEKCAKIYGKSDVVLVAPNDVDKSWKSMHRSYQRVPSICISLGYQLQWKEPEKLGLLMQISKPTIISRILMLMEVFRCTAPLNSVLQKGYMRLFT